ncbi:MAG: NAD(P)-binding protein [Acidimicrobiaceae bacterium]|nr:FAD-dependent oxidoreductase [Acidimicrobiaceae bacterium]MDE0515568.1 FAD-dependent oxidoreductase [Acidimicrobiaceae bacterium]MDE0655989.1 FAD-dependent oxidoreductase [Acidimicrobiaceae bacterium]MXZ96871.1 NAD(P)-binding protein [Acidimicrobiaceae bacterium]MYF42976.1 NAD(P)-binding protein [Acidimicrobiaceae bacterium]
MAREAKYDVLFDQVPVGPKTLRNRFWQVPHCNGAGSDKPGMQAEFRGIKAEGGWAAVFTEICLMTPDSDPLPWVGSRIWDNGDIRNLALMCEKVQAHGSLAGVELTHGGGLNHNAETRLPARGASQIPSDISAANCRAMSVREIRQIQREHVDAALRARAAGFDLLTLFCGLANITNFFMYPFYNKRTDSYGGSFQNRLRFTKEVLEMMREVIDDCAIGIRMPIDTLDEPYGYGDAGFRAEHDAPEYIETLDPLVDYWDLNVGTLNWGEDAGSSRFFATNHQADYTRIAKQHTAKPCVNVGRFTDPDVMVEAITSGQCDVIGAARPSISDPYLPRKIEEGRLDDIRECIGCNVCVSRWEIGGPPIWCTQNPTSGEEYRRGWHPEHYTPASNRDTAILVVGAGPAGLEAAMVLGKRGYEAVHVVDGHKRMGGHVSWVSTMPGFSAWRRVIDWRETQINKLDNVQFVGSSRLSTSDIVNYGAEHVIIATGSVWAADGMNGPMHEPITGADASQPHVCTPEQVVVDGKELGRRVLVVDHDNYYMGSAMAQLAAEKDCDVTYVTHWDSLGEYLRFTLEEQRMWQRLTELGVEVLSQHLTLSVEGGVGSLLHLWSGRERAVDFDSVILVTQRNSVCDIYDELHTDDDRLADAGIASIHLIGDAHTPGMIAQSVFSGHRLAREFDSPDPSVALPFIRERRLVGGTDDDYTLASVSIRP